MADSITISSVRSGKDFRTFVLFPWKIYKNDPNWVPPLISNEKKLLNRDKNPFFLHSEAEYFLARKNGEVVGRIAAIVNHNHNEFHEEKTGFFGFFECQDDQDVANALFETAENWLRERGMDRIRGPLNPSTNDTCGLLVDAFHLPPVVMMTYNPQYYIKLIEGVGLQKAKDLYAYYMDTSVPISDKIKRMTDLIRKRNNITIRSINMKRLKEEVDLVKKVYNDAWSRNWGFVPMTDEEFDHLAKDLKQIVVPDLAIFAFVDDEPAGFSLSLPDINQALRRINGRLFPTGLFKLLWYSRKINMLRVLIMGVRKKYQKMGIDAVFYYETYVRGVKNGFHKGEFSWILEDNYPMRHSLENMGATIYKTYRIYEKEL